MQNILPLHKYRHFRVGYFFLNCPVHISIVPEARNFRGGESSVPFGEFSELIEVPLMKQYDMWCWLLSVSDVWHLYLCYVCFRFGFTCSSQLVTIL